MSITRIPRMLGIVNAFLVAEDDGLTLIDTTMGRGAAKAILAAAGKQGRPIVRVALTHAHQDHIGGLDALVAELPGVEVLISARDAKLLAKDLTPTQAADVLALNPASRPTRSCAAATPARRPARRVCSHPATGSARSRSSPPPATPRATLRSWTPATAR